MTNTSPRGVNKEQMEIMLFIAGCILYNGMYLGYQIKQKRIKGAVGTAAMMALAAAGMVLLRTTGNG